MRIKRFCAPTIREAIRLVRAELGPDAVILSNRRVEGGMEIVAATDYDEAAFQPPTAAAGTSRQPGVATRATSGDTPQEPALHAMRRELNSLRGLLEHQLSGLAWGELARRHPLRARLITALRHVGLSATLAREIAAAAEGRDYDSLWRQALAVLAHRVAVTNDDILDRGGIVAMVGPTGVGKTTTVAKLAARCVLRHGARHVGLITMDNYRIGAHEQIRTYGRILGLPVRQVGTIDELRQAVAALRDRRLVLIDTAGMGHRDLRLAEQLAILASVPQVRTCLVMSANTQYAGLNEVLRAFRPARPQSCVLTKLDEAPNLGGALSVVVQTQLPVAYLSDGQRVPEDLQPARAHNLVSAAVALSQQTAGRAGVAPAPVPARSSVNARI